MKNTIRISTAIMMIVGLCLLTISLTSFKSESDPNYFGVTEIAGISNKTGGNLYLLNIENSSDNVTLGPNESQNVAIWIPWADNKDQYERKHLEFRVAATSVTYYVWQSNGRVRYSTDGWHDNGTAIPGSSDEDGKRTITVSADNINCQRYQ